MLIMKDAKSFVSLKHYSVYLPMIRKLNHRHNGGAYLALYVLDLVENFSHYFMHCLNRTALGGSQDVLIHPTLCTGYGLCRQGVGLHIRIGIEVYTYRRGLRRCSFQQCRAVLEAQSK